MPARIATGRSRPIYVTPGHRIVLVGTGSDTRDQTGRKAAPANHGQHSQQLSRHPPRRQIRHPHAHRPTWLHNTNSPIPWGPTKQR